MTTASNDTSDAPIFFEHRTPPRPEVVNIRFSTDELTIMDREAKRFDVSRSELIRVAVGRLLTSIPDADAE